MVSENWTASSRVKKVTVLILVLVEDGLRDQVTRGERDASLQVLILVLVEDGLRDLWLLYL